MVSTFGSFLLRLVWPLLLLWVSTHRFKKNPLEGGDDDDSIAKALGPRVPMKIMGNKKRKPNRRRKKLIEKIWMSGLAMWRGGRRPDQGGCAAAGPSEQRAPQRSAARRSRSGGPKKTKKASHLPANGKRRLLKFMTNQRHP